MLTVRSDGGSTARVGLAAQGRQRMGWKAMEIE